MLQNHKELVAFSLGRLRRLWSRGRDGRFTLEEFCFSHACEPQLDCVFHVLWPRLGGGCPGCSTALSQVLQQGRGCGEGCSTKIYNKACEELGLGLELGSGDISWMREMCQCGLVRPTASLADVCEVSSPANKSHGHDCNDRGNNYFIVLSS